MNKKVRAKRMSRAKSMIAVVAASALLATGSLSALTVSAASVEKGNLASAGKFYTDYATHAEALEAARELNVQIAEEGQVLLKNDGLLPMSTRSYVSVFGTGEDALIGGAGSVSQSLIDAGFKVNPALKAFYASDSYGSSSGGNGFSSGGGNIGKESLEFGPRVETTFSLYSDAAVVVFSRNGGEGSDPARVINEKNDDSANINGWKHEALATAKDGGEYKHYLQLTDQENALLDYVHERFDKVIVVLNTSNIMEMYNLQYDERINAIISMDRPGATGVTALGEILSGAVTPSGKTAETWYRDFTADPTWYNFGNNIQTSKAVEFVTGGGGGGGGFGGGFGGGGSSGPTAQGDNTNTFTFAQKNAKGEDQVISALTGVSYEESIYMGYKYYETVYAEIKEGNLYVVDGKLAAAGSAEQTGETVAEKWYNDNVVYPFGYGMSYTSFDMKMGKVYYVDDAAETVTELPATVAPADFASSVEKGEAKIKTLYAPVTVTNTGKVAGKQVAEIYVTAPYTKGEIEKSYVKLVGYGKTDLLQPGASQTIVVSFNVQDFASFDYNDANKNNHKNYELDEGKYEIKLMSDSHTAVATQEFTISGSEAAVLELDDFTGNKVEATEFSDPNSEYYTMIGENVKFSEKEADWSGKTLYGTGSNMTLMSRANFAETFPDAHKATDYIATLELLEYLDKYCATVSADLDDETARWALTEEQLTALMKGWKQANSKEVAARENGKCETLLRDMAGVPLYDEKGNVSEEWTNFMNQLSFDEIAKLITQCSQSTCAIPSIGKLAARNIDGPNSTADMSWMAESGIGCTWNTALAYKQGAMVGDLYTLKGYTSWYAPATNMHRSPFGGRCNEYYSSDGIHAGYLTVAAATGCESRGVNCYIKHFALNDQETNRTNIATYADEQNIRENYLIPFQMGVQEGGASALMLTFSRVGVVGSAENYVLIQDIVRDEWGFNGVIGTDFFPYRQSGWTVEVNGENKTFAGGNTTVMDLMLRVGGVHPLGNGADLSSAWLEDASGNGKVVLKENADLATVQAFPEYVAPEDGKTSTFVHDGFTYVVTSTAGRNGSYTLSAVKYGKDEAKIDYYYARLQAMRICYVYANSVNIDNGIVFGDNFTFILDYVDSSRQPQPETMEKTLTAGTVGVAYDQTYAATQDELGEGNVATYSISKGALPNGLTLNAATGQISGYPTEAGEFKFTMRATVANNYGEVNLTLNIAEGITMNGETEIEAGEEVDIFVQIAEGSLPASVYNGGITYSATGLPEGVTIDQEGNITGTPAEAGVYEVTVKIAATRGSGKNAVTDTYTRTFTLVVNGAGYEAPYIGENGHWYVDGVDTGVSATGPKGDKGDTGEAGPAGPKGEKGDKGDKGDTGASGAAGQDGKPGADGQDGSDGKGGCGSVIGIGSAIVATLTVLGGAAIVLRKKN